MPHRSRRRLLQASAFALAWPTRVFAEKPLLEVSAQGRPVKAFDRAALQALPQVSQLNPTPWYDRPRKFTGPLLRDVMQAAGVRGTRVQATALNDYKVEIPFKDLQDFEVIVAHLLDDEPMTIRAKGPLFVMYPFSAQPQLRNPLYYTRCIWQLTALDIG